MPQSIILVSAIRGTSPLGAISPHVPNVRVHSHVSLLSRNVWADEVMYRGSAVNALNSMFARLGTDYEIRNQWFFAILEAMTTD